MLGARVIARGRGRSRGRVRVRAIQFASSTRLKRPPAFSTAASTHSRSSARKEMPETQSTTPASGESRPSASGSSAPLAALSWIQDGRTTGNPSRRAQASLRERGVTLSATRCVVWSVRSGEHTPLSAAADASSRRRASEERPELHSTSGMFKSVAGAAQHEGHVQKGLARANTTPLMGGINCGLIIVREIRDHCRAVKTI